MDYLYRLTNVSGIFTADQSRHLAMIICHHHREIYGPALEKWKNEVCVPIEVAGHKDPKTKGVRGLNSRESSFILVTLGELHSAESRFKRYDFVAYEKLTTSLRLVYDIVGEL